MIGVSILGATGSVGVNTLDVLARHPDRFRVVALSAQQNSARLLEQCLVHRPEYAVIGSAELASDLQQQLRRAGLPTEVWYGPEALADIASLEQTDYVMAAIVGAAGLLPTLAAARAGKRVMLANKEALVMTGALFIDEVRRHGAELLPIDSEHNALFQCLPAGFKQGLDKIGVTRLLLTGSGGPFRETPLSDLAAMTPDQACAHPNWSMGRKISVDSATMMNKGLEVIEAQWLFSAPLEKIEIIVHPQSVIHSMVEYNDGSVLAQLGHPDMRTPIAHALAWPERIDAGLSPLDLFGCQLDFQTPDYQRFPCLHLAREAAASAGTAPALLNAANEIAVQAFLDQRIRFTDISATIAEVMAQIPVTAADSVEQVLEQDGAARRAAAEYIKRLS